MMILSLETSYYSVKTHYSMIQLTDRVVIFIIEEYVWYVQHCTIINSRNPYI
jgi:hypothetical protein